MLYQFDRLKTRAFTLIELIVVIVLLGLLAGLSVPTFKQVLNNAQFDVQLASMQALGRQAAADGLFKEGVFELDEVRKNITSTTPAGSWTHVERSTNFRELASSVSADSSQLRLAALSSTGECIVIDVKGSKVTQVSGDPADCTATFSVDEEETPGGGEAPNPPEEETPVEEEPTEPPVEEVPVVVEETPTNVNASYATNAVTLTWVGSSASYKVERLNPDGQWAVLTETATDGTYVDSNTQPGMTYSYRISGANAEGVYGEASENSSEVVLAPSAPSSVSVTYNAQTRKNTVTWSAAPGAVNYTLTGSGANVQTTETNTVVDAQLGTTNTYTVRANNAGGTSSTSSANVIVPGSCEVGRAVACDSVVEADLKTAGALAAATLRENGRTMTQIFNAATNNASLYADNGSGLLGSSGVLWNPQGNVKQLSPSPGVLIEIVHVRTANSTWPTAHGVNDFCGIGRASGAASYNYPGGNVLLYNKQAYYDSKMGGFVTFKQIADAQKAGQTPSCYAYAKRFMDSGGVV